MRLAGPVAGLVAGLAVPVLAVGCAVSGVDETGTPLPVTGEALVVLARDHVDLGLDPAGTPATRRDESCRGNSRFVRAVAEFGGSRVSLTLETGGCRGSKVAYVCHEDRVPLGQDGHAVPLGACDREEVGGGRVLYTGTRAGRQHPPRRIAVLYDRGLRYTVTTSAESRVRGYELAEIAQDPRVGATVDAAYVVAGRDLPRSRDR